MRTLQQVVGSLPDTERAKARRRADEIIAMSHSRKRTPISGITTERSEKRFKQQEKRRQRAAARSGREFIPQSYGPKDGRQWRGKHDPKTLRK